MLLMVLVFSGCDSMHHAIYKYKGYNIILVSGPGAEDSVDSHCRKYVKKWDNGKPIDNQLIRACFLPHGSRKSNIVISEEHIDCLPHELCHADGQDEEYCGEKYPCVGEAL